jgi:hypothetical protein
MLLQNMLDAFGWLLNCSLTHFSLFRQSYLLEGKYRSKAGQLTAFLGSCIHAPIQATVSAFVAF